MSEEKHVVKKMNVQHILRTGLNHCYDEDGEIIDCRGSGQDADFFSHGVSENWSTKRYELVGDHLVRDMATGLIWSRNSCPSEYPLNWQESLDFVEQMNHEKRFGRTDWRMPNRRELRSLIDHGCRKPALSPGHPFENVFLGWYWSSTTAALAPRYAWYVHLEGGRMFYGNKDGYYWLWPVCGNSDILARTGATRCYDLEGSIISCAESRQDGALSLGVSWPAPRFVPVEHGVVDALTGLTWHGKARLGKVISTWSEALAAVTVYGQETHLPWRMPTINELESLVDASTYSPSLIEGHPFTDIQAAYWSSTTSSFETDWAYVLYLAKGAVGVGYKKNSDFALWPVLSQTSREQI